MLLNTFPTRADFAAQAANATVIPVGATILADMETPVSLLARFADATDLFLLESAEGGERWGRYSFMGISARANLTIYREEVVLRQGVSEERMPHHGDPLAVVRQLLRPYQLAEIPGLPRLCGGLVGYFAYEMVHFFEPRVANKLPAEQPLGEFIIPDTLLVFDNTAHTLTILALAFTADGEPDSLYDQARSRIAGLLQELAAPPPPAPRQRRAGVTLPAPLRPPDYYQGMVKRLKEEINAGEVIQCVVSQSFVGPAPDDLVALYRAQRFVNPSPYLFFLKARGCTLIGSSPETMVRLDNRSATLRPIAGTRKRGANEQEDRRLADELLQDAKERSEHLMLVDLGRHELGRVARPGTVQVTDLMTVERYSHVMHLVSNITAELEPEVDAYDLIRASFPAGTLSGAPKVRAMELIAELEAEPRGAYGGAVGYLSFDGNMDFCICIRTAVVSHGRLTIRAGAGIVADSDPVAEYQETMNKAAAMMRAIELLASATTAAAAP